MPLRVRWWRFLPRPAPAEKAERCTPALSAPRRPRPADTPRGSTPCRKRQRRRRPTKSHGLAIASSLGANSGCLSEPQRGGWKRNNCRPGRRLRRRLPGSEGACGLGDKAPATSPAPASRMYRDVICHSALKHSQGTRPRPPRDSPGVSQAYTAMDFRSGASRRDDVSVARKPGVAR